MRPLSGREGCPAVAAAVVGASASDGLRDMGRCGIAALPLLVILPLRKLVLLRPSTPAPSLRLRSAALAPVLL